MVVKRAAGDARLGRERVERDMGEALRGEGLTRRGDKARGGLFGGLGPARRAGQDRGRGGLG